MAKVDDLRGGRDAYPASLLSSLRNLRKAGVRVVSMCAVDTMMLVNREGDPLQKLHQNNTYISENKLIARVLQREHTYFIVSTLIILSGIYLTPTIF